MSKKISKILVFLIIIAAFAIMKPINTFAAKKVSLSDPSVKVKLEYSSYEYTGKPIYPKVTVTHNGKKCIRIVIMRLNILTIL